MKAYNLKTALELGDKTTELFIHGRGLKHVPEAILQFKNLTKLGLTGNQIQSIPDSFITFFNQIGLKGLEFGNSDLSAFPKEILKITSLEELTISNTRITDLPKGIQQLSNLKQLNLFNNQLKKIPNSINKLQNLKVLNLRNNQIKTLPESLCECQNLEGLYVDSNKLNQLPENIGNLSQLKRLMISNNRLERFPSSLSKLQQLTDLNAADNKIEELPEDLGNLSQLIRLWLNDNKIEIIPELEWDNSPIEQLFLSNNQIEFLPDGLTDLTSLRVLWLEKNYLKSLPDQIGRLNNLNRLVLRNNNIEKLPDSFQELTKIKFLSLANNEFKQLPFPLLALEKLEKLELEPAVISTTTKTFCNFLHKAREFDLSFDDRLALIHALGGNSDSLQKLSLNRLFNVLNLRFRGVSELALRTILKKKEVVKRKKQLKQNAVISFLGETQFDKNNIKERIESAGLNLENKPNKNTTHLILGVFPKGGEEWLMNSSISILHQQELNEFLQKIEKPYLLQVGNVELDNLKKLLLNQQSENVNLAVQMLKGGGVPKSLLTAILIAYKATKDNSLKRQLKAILDLNLSLDARSMLSFRKGFFDEETTYLKIMDITKNTELDGQEIFENLYQKN